MTARFLHLLLYSSLSTISLTFLFQQSRTPFSFNNLAHLGSQSASRHSASARPPIAPTSTHLKEHRRLASAKMLESLADTRRRRARQAANRRAAMRPSAFFEKLPPEIRLMIFDFAYGTDAESIKVNLTRTESVNGNALKCAFDPIIGISKQWFIESFDRNVRSTRFAFEKFDAIEDLLRRLPSIKKSITSVSWRVKHEFEIGRQMVSLCKSAPNIKAIHVYATDYIYGDHLLDPRFRSLYEELLNLRGLDSFQLTTDEDLSWASEKFRSKCEDGARHFVDTVVKHVTKAKGVS